MVISDRLLNAQLVYYKNDKKLNKMKITCISGIIKLITQSVKTPPCHWKALESTINIITYGGADGKSVLGSDLYEIEMQFFLLGTFIETRKKYHSREAGNSVNL